MSWPRLSFVCALALLCGIGTCVADAARLSWLSDNFIVGGNDTTIEKHPYQLGLLFSGTQECGASILSQKIAVTSAFCVDGQKASTITVRAGSSMRSSGGQVLSLTKYSTHPQYEPGTMDYDVAVLVLSSDIKLGPSAAAIALQPNGEELGQGVLVTVTGWGTQREGITKDYPEQLQEVSVPVLSDDDCRNLQEGVTARMLCAGYVAGRKGPCQGDSGGPLVLDGILVGIVSRLGCGRRLNPSVYTKISDKEIHRFITNKMK